MKFPILLPNIFNYPFTYESDLKLEVGDFVEVPFGKSKISGLVWFQFEKKNEKKFKTKKVLKKLNIPKLKKQTIEEKEILERTAKKCGGEEVTAGEMQGSEAKKNMGEEKKENSRRFTNHLAGVRGKKKKKNPKKKKKSRPAPKEIFL